jgi:hypothetical protein
MNEAQELVKLAADVLAFKRTPHSPRPVSKRLTFPQVLQLAKKEAKRLRTTVFVIKRGREYVILDSSEYHANFANVKAEARVSQDGRIAKSMKANSSGGYRVKVNVSNFDVYEGTSLSRAPIRASADYSISNGQVTIVGYVNYYVKSDKIEVMDSRRREPRNVSQKARDVILNLMRKELKSWKPPKRRSY